MPRYGNVNGIRIQFTAEEETARDAEEAVWAANAPNRAAAKIRKKRDALLAETDYLALGDVTMSSAWTTYRQALRDIPSQEGFPNDEGYTVTYPTKPS